MGIYKVYLVNRPMTISITFPPYPSFLMVAVYDQKYIKYDDNGGPPA